MLILLMVVLSDPAIERIDNSPIDKMIITDSILARNDVKESSKIEQLIYCTFNW